MALPNLPKPVYNNPNHGGGAPPLAPQRLARTNSSPSFFGPIGSGPEQRMSSLDELFNQRKHRTFEPDPVAQMEHINHGRKSRTDVPSPQTMMHGSRRVSDLLQWDPELKMEKRNSAMNSGTASPVGEREENGGGGRRVSRNERNRTSISMMEERADPIGSIPRQALGRPPLSDAEKAKWRMHPEMLPPVDHRKKKSATVLEALTEATVAKDSAKTWHGRRRSSSQTDDRQLATLL